MTELNTLGKALSPADGFKAFGAINAPYNGIAVDRSGNVWIANAGNNTITEFVGAAAPVATPRTQGRPVSPEGAMAPDTKGCSNPCDGKKNGDNDDGHCGGDS